MLLILGDSHKQQNYTRQLLSSFLQKLNFLDCLFIDLFLIESEKKKSERKEEPQPSEV